MDDPNAFGSPRAEHGLELRMRGEGRRISSQHEQLAEFFQEIGASLDRGSLQAARLAFTRFRDALEAHISVEDRIFFPALRGLRPDLEPQLSSLVSDHASFRAELEELHDLLAAGSSETFEERLVRFGGAFSAHERIEERLLADAPSG